MFDFSDGTRTSISILTSAADLEFKSILFIIVIKKNMFMYNNYNIKIYLDDNNNDNIYKNK